MKEYLKLLKQKMYFGFILILCCACLGSFRGAFKEHGEPLCGVTQKDIQIMQQQEQNSPDLVGIIALASEQNRWYNFAYAFAYGKRGIVLYCFLMIIYLPMYHFRCFKVVRQIIGRKNDENKLFINVDTI